MSYALRIHGLLLYNSKFSIILRILFSQDCQRTVSELLRTDLQLSINTPCPCPVDEEYAYRSIESGRCSCKAA